MWDLTSISALFHDCQPLMNSIEQNALKSSNIKKKKPFSGLNYLDSMYLSIFKCGTICFTLFCLQTNIYSSRILIYIWHRLPYSDTLYILWNQESAPQCCIYVLLNFTWPWIEPSLELFISQQLSYFPIDCVILTYFHWSNGLCSQIIGLCIMKVINHSNTKA